MFFFYLNLLIVNIPFFRKANIFDNMLAIMEKYANNLEALVADRTQQLSDEKKMTENLLFRMLPRLYFYHFSFILCKFLLP